MAKLRKKSTRKRASKSITQRQTVVVSVGGATRARSAPQPRSNSLLTSAPVLVQTHMRVDPDRNLDVLHSKIDALAAQQIQLNVAMHQDAMDMVRRMRVDPNALVVASRNPQDAAVRAAMLAPSQDVMSGTDVPIKLEAPAGPPQSMFASSATTQPVAEHHQTSDAMTWTDEQAPTPRGIDISVASTPKLQIAPSPATWRSVVKSRNAIAPEYIDPRGLAYSTWRSAYDAGQASARPESARTLDHDPSPPMEKFVWTRGKSLTVM